MGKKIVAILIFICIVAGLISLVIYNVNKSKEEDFLMLKQKYEPLNSVNLKELDKFSSDEFKKIMTLYDNYREDIHIREGKDDRVKTIVPNIEELSRAFGKEASKRDREKKRKFKLEKENKNYERFLREVKGITEEKIIKEKLARLEVIREREKNSSSGDVFTFSDDDSDNLKAGNGITEDEVKERKEFKEYCKSLDY